MIIKVEPLYSDPQDQFESKYDDWARQAFRVIATDPIFLDETLEFLVHVRINWKTGLPLSRSDLHLAGPYTFLETHYERKLGKDWKKSPGDLDKVTFFSWAIRRAFRAILVRPGRYV